MMLRRTLVGSTLAIALALALWLTSRSGDGRPIYWTCAVIVIGAVFEASRMGHLGVRTLQPVLLVAAAGYLLLTWQAISGAELSAELAARYPEVDLSPLRVYRPDLAVAYAWTFALALAAYGTLQAIGRAAPRAGPLARALLYAGFCALIVFALNDAALVSASIRPAFAVLAILALTTLPLVALDRAWTGLAITVGLALWLIPPLPALWQIWAQWGMRGLIALIVLSKIGDTAGYYIGSAIGRSHPFPKISPGKTTAGCVASLLAATITGGVLAATGFLPAGRLGIGAGLLAGALVNLAAQSGDLFESWVKRRAGVKDSSGVFGPAGGVLDQIDSLLFSVPAALLLWPALFS